MKKLVVVVVVTLFCFSSCKRDNTSWRYLLRSASKASQAEEVGKDDKSLVKEYDFRVMSVAPGADTLSRKFYRVGIVLPPDTLHYFSYTSIGLPSIIGIADEPKALVQVQYFLHTDTVTVYATRLIMYDKGVRKN
jgi:hypothetical protein